MRLSTNFTFASAILLTLACFAQGANAWVVKGKWNTAKFYCQDAQVEIGVDMKSRIGGGDASPIRSAYMVVGGKKYDSVWIVGSSMNTVSANNRDYALILGKSIYLESIGRKDRSCVVN